MFNKFKQKAAESKALPKDILLGLPYITIIGNTEISIENFRGIVEYSDDVVRINTGAGIVRISGKKLFLKQITSEIINISGTIKSFEFL